LGRPFFISLISLPAEAPGNQLQQFNKLEMERGDGRYGAPMDVCYPEIALLGQLALATPHWPAESDDAS
jgi:hypothetical protein